MNTLFWTGAACLFTVGFTRQLTPALNLTRELIENDQRQPHPELKLVNVTSKDWFLFSTVKINRNYIHCDIHTEDDYMTISRVLPTGGHESNLGLYNMFWR